MLKFIAICSIFMMIAGYTVVRDTQTRQKNSTLSTSGTSTTYNFTTSGSTTDMPRPAKVAPAQNEFTPIVVEDPPCVGVNKEWLGKAFDGGPFSAKFNALDHKRGTVQDAVLALSTKTTEVSEKKETIETLNKEIQDLIAQGLTLAAKLDADVEKWKAGNTTQFDLTGTTTQMEEARKDEAEKRSRLQVETKALETIKGEHAAAMTKAKEAMSELKKVTDDLATAVDAGVGALDEKCGVAAEEAPKKQSWSPTWATKWASRGHKQKHTHSKQREDDSEES